MSLSLRAPSARLKRIEASCRKRRSRRGALRKQISKEKVKQLRITLGAGEIRGLGGGGARFARLRRERGEERSDDAEKTEPGR